MVFKINIGEKGKTYKVESDSETLIGKKIGETFEGNEVSNELNGYQLQIRGTSDNAGFAGVQTENGPALRGVLFTKGKFLKRVPHQGYRRKKTVRGNEISPSTVQINCVVVKQGHKKLDELFPSAEKAA